MRTALMAGLMAVAAASGSPALAAEAARARFGSLADGRAVEAVTLTNRNGVSATVINWGATLQSVIAPDRRGRRADIALGYADMAGYLAKSEYFGATVGRFANRIARGRFRLDGRSYSVPVNNGPNSLHGGTAGFDKVLWDVVSVDSGPTASVTLRYVSRDGDQGYPGTVTVEATYSLDERDAITVEYRATTDRATVVNVTNHAYWNLAGEGDPRGAMGHVLTIPADRYTPVDSTLIPTGELRSVQGTAFDFRRPTVVGDRVREAADEQVAYGRGYDHNWVFGDRVTADVRLNARVEDPVSGRTLEVWSNQPGMQFYSGNFFDGTVIGKSRRIYRMGDTVVFEPQLFPDTPNQPSFPSARLEPGQTYRNTIVFRLGTNARRR